MEGGAVVGVDRVGASVQVGQPRPVQPEVDLRLVNTGVLSRLDGGARRDAGEGEEQRRHNQKEKEPDRHPANQVERHVLILMTPFCLSKGSALSTIQTPS